MSRTNIAIVKLVLRTNKTLSDGTHPIMLRCSFHGLKEVSTLHSCTPKYWDKKNMCIKKGYSSNYVFVNSQLRSMYDAAIARRDHYIAQGIDYTPSMVLRGDSLSPVPESTKVVDLISRYVLERGVSRATCRSWTTLLNQVMEYDAGVRLGDISLQWARAFASWLTEKGVCDGTVNLRLSKIAALYVYGAEKGIVSMEDYPFKYWRFRVRYAASSRMTYINWRSMEQMRDWFLGKVCLIEDGSYKLREGIWDTCLDPYSRDNLFSIFFFLLSYIFQGLAPVDIASIRWADVDTRIVNGKEMFYWEGKRRKTGARVVVMIDRGVRLNRVMLEILSHRRDKEYMLPFLDGLENATVEERDGRLGMFLWNNSKRLRRGIEEVNAAIRAYNRSVIESNEKAGRFDIQEGVVPLIPADDITWYSARHSFAMAFMTKGGSPIQLATLMGKSVSTLHQYIEALSHEGDIAEAVSIMS